MQDSTDEFIVKVHDVLKIEEVQDKLETYTAEKLQDKSFAYTKDNLLKCWGFLLLFSAIYALLGLLALELVDKDKR